MHEHIAGMTRTTGRTAWRRMLLTGLWLLAFAATGVQAVGVESPDPLAEAVAPVSATHDAQMSVQEIVRQGGKLMYVLAAMSVFGLGLIVYFFIVLRPSQVAPRALQRELVEKIRAGDTAQAARACEYRPCPLGIVAMSALDYVRNVPDVDSVVIKDVIEGEGSRQADAIQGQIQYLLDLGVVAPMVGLLGTVFGMLQAFSAVGLDIAKARPMVLAEGISKALITTAFGLIVAIPAMTFYAYFRRRTARLVAGLEIAAADVMAALLSRRGERSTLGLGVE